MARYHTLLRTQEISTLETIAEQSLLSATSISAVTSAASSLSAVRCFKWYAKALVMASGNAFVSRAID